MNHLLPDQAPASLEDGKVDGRVVTLAGEPFYLITNVNRMRPFFLSIVSSGDLWMFISSNGALTAGRRHPDLALFPYYTDDKIHDAVETTGPKTIFIAEKRGERLRWEPFSERDGGRQRIRRHLYKNFHGNKIVFEEANDGLGLTFRYHWTSSEKFGWVRTATLVNTARDAIRVRLLDGLQNLLPSGVGSQFQLEKSTLIDAYKKNELLPDGGLGVFRLSSLPVDRPEPAEALRATTVWSAGLTRRRVLLSSVQVERFRRDLPLTTETEVRAERGAYLIESQITLRPRQARRWLLVADTEQSSARVADLRRALRDPVKLRKRVEADVAQSAEELWRLVAGADGLQKTARPLGDARHFGNVLFNLMRGGVFAAGYEMEVADVSAFVRRANAAVASRQRAFFQRLGRTVSLDRLVALARKTGDPDLERLCQEYLPLTFSRRHGDPSRPWNRFSIPGRDAAGRRILNYEGNWRDIFQNWEALAVSFPGFAAGMICKFANASTADGYNPYRIMRDGLDWEIPDPHDPWAHIGYWGDHQIIYLLKLLELLERHDPAALRGFLTREIFAFANVPYRIKPYAQLLKNPRETVDFDAALHQRMRERVARTGMDGKLLSDRQGRVLHVNLTEKLLVSILAKLANFIPGAGIWLNTQRPEWNDANNALVGNGASVVTLCQLRRHLAFCRQLISSLEADGVRLSAEVARWLKTTVKCLNAQSPEALGDADRRRMLDGLGRAAQTYRRQIYATGFSGKTIRVTRDELLNFFSVALEAAEASIRANRRADGLYHAYNLVEFDDPRGIFVRRLPEMLEGQAAILGANLLSAAESLDVLTALRRSALYRADQHSYLLYPDRRLPRFWEQNQLPPAFVARSALLRKLLADGNRQLIERDADGICHFAPAVRNAGDVRQILDGLARCGYANPVKRDAAAVLELFETLFNHRSFTGRSGTFFGYEGLGCIYWHMVSKLLLAAQESFERAARTPLAEALAERYHDIRAGLGDCKTPANYGAFPMDPYSHTPGHAGARQPGLTGQVKEDILCRLGELGVRVQNGRIHFEPRLLRKAEFLTAPEEFAWLDVAGKKRRHRLQRGELAFTYCQVLIVYRLAKTAFIRTVMAGGTVLEKPESFLDRNPSRSVFDRTGRIRKILVGVTLGK